MGAPSNSVSIGKDEAVSSKNFWCFSFDKTPWEKGWRKLGREAFKESVGVPPALKTVNLFQGESLRYS